MTEKNLFCIFKPTFFIYNTIVHTIRDFCITNIGETRILSLADSNNLNNFNIYIPSSGKDEAEFNMLILAIIDAFQSLVLFFEVSKENNIPCMDSTDYTFIKISYRGAVTGSKKEQNIKSININSTQEEFINIHKLILIRTPGIFGPGAKPNNVSVVSTFCHNIVNNIKSTINDPEKILEIYYIDDLIFLIEGLFKSNTNLKLIQPESVKISVIGLYNLIENIASNNRSLNIDGRYSSSFIENIKTTYNSFKYATK
jgi:hypothetical protein